MFSKKERLYPKKRPKKELNTLNTFEQRPAAVQEREFALVRTEWEDQKLLKSKSGCAPAVFGGVGVDRCGRLAFPGVVRAFTSDVL